MNSELKIEDEDKRAIELNNFTKSSSWPILVAALVALAVGYLAGYFHKGMKDSVYNATQEQIVNAERAKVEEKLAALDAVPSIKEQEGGEQVITISEHESKLDQLSSIWKEKYRNKKVDPVEIPVIPKGLITWEQCTAANVLRPPQSANDLLEINEYRKSLGLKELSK